MSIVLVMNNSGARVVGCDVRATSIISDALSFDIEDAKFRAGMKLGTWNSKQSFLRLPDYIFEAGFVPLVRQTLSEHGYPVAVKDMRDTLDARGPAIDLTAPTGWEVADDGKKYPVYGGYLEGVSLYDFQAAAVETFAREKRGILQIATGGGKTETAIAITKRVGRPTLFLTHKVDLVSQTRKRYAKRLGKAPGMISEGEWLPADVTVATVQTIMSHFKQDAEKVLAYLRSVEVLIVDEAHRSSGTSFFTVISNCVNAYYRCSLTATPLMKESREDNLRLIATSGNIISRVTNKELIDRGILAQPYFKFREVPSFGFSEARVKKDILAAGKKVTAGAVYQAAYKQGIVHNEQRNAMIADDVRELVAEGRKVVVLFKEIGHGKILERLLKEAGFKAELVYGEDDPTVREAALARLRSGEVNPLIASTILDEGLDEDSISGLVLAGSGKSKVSLRQRVGRAVRRKKGAELDRLGNTAKVRDYIDTGSKHLMKHSALRWKEVTDEEGWILEGFIMWDDRKRAA